MRKKKHTSKENSQGKTVHYFSARSEIFHKTQVNKRVCYKLGMEK